MCLFLFLASCPGTRQVRAANHLLKARRRLETLPVPEVVVVLSVRTHATVSH